MTNCSNCKSDKSNHKAVPYIVHESMMARAERSAKRLWAVIILLIVFLVASNGVWIWHESQFEVVETTEITQKNADGYNNYIGNDGDINNGNADNKKD